MRDHCRFGPELKIETDALYKTYRQWCLDTGRNASNQATFGRDLRAARPEVKVHRLGPRGDRTRTYVGASLAVPYGTYDTEDTEEVRVIGVLGNDHCITNNEVCSACDGFGCPTCQPERFGLPPKKKRQSR